MIIPIIRLFIARLRRQQAEQDRQILANRVHLLEIEAKKAQKMINETKRRTAQLRKQKQARADERFAKAEKEAAERETMQKRQAAKRSSLEEKLKVEKDSAKRILLKRRAAKAAQVRSVVFCGGGGERICIIYRRNAFIITTVSAYCS